MATIGQPTDVDFTGTSTVQWQIDPLHCPILREHRIVLIGHSQPGSGYRIVRKNPAFSNINLTISGRGEVLIQGEWQEVTAGVAALAPRGVLHGSRSVRGGDWEFCWICFSEPEGLSPRIGVGEVTLTHTDPKPLASNIVNFFLEWRDTRQEVVLNALLQLIELYVRRITAPLPIENHLWKLWDKVCQAPAHPWTDEEMARLANLSSRHLLRLSRKETGRTLHEQLAHIRLSKAASLLHVQSLKLQAVAEAVGYRDAFAFSKAFKRWSGVSPKAYRSGF